MRNSGTAGQDGGLSSRGDRVRRRPVLFHGDWSWHAAWHLRQWRPAKQHYGRPGQRQCRLLRRVRPRIRRVWSEHHRQRGKGSDVKRDQIILIIIIILAIETLGPLNSSTLNFLSEVGRRLISLSGDSRETSFLFQHLSIIIQFFNSALIMDSFCFSDEDPDLLFLASSF